MFLQLFESMLEDNRQLGEHEKQTLDRQFWKKTCCYFMSKSTSTAGELAWYGSAAWFFRYSMNCGSRASKLTFMDLCKDPHKAFHYVLHCTEVYEGFLSSCAHKSYGTRTC